MNNQETFDFVLNKIREQGKASYDKDKQRCLYRYKDCKCAAGHLFPDEQYKPEFEGSGVNYDTEVGQLIQSLGYDVGLVAALQSCHDLAAGWDDGQFIKSFNGSMKATAKRWGLEYKD